VLQFRLIIICILSLAVAACSGGGGGGGGSRTVTGTSSSYSSDGATQIITTTYSDGTTSTTNYAPISTSYSYSADGSQKTPVYTFANGATNNGTTLTGTLTTPVYSPDGSQKTLRYSFSDGTTNNGTTLTGTPSDPVYSGSQLSYKYSFSDGSKSPTQTLNISTKSSESYSSNGTTKTVTYTLGSGKQVSFTLAGTAGTATYKADGSEKYIPYSYMDSTSYTATVTGTKTNPLSDAAVYPSNWTTTGSVTKPVTHALFYSFSDQTTYTVEDGTSAKPFNQSNLTPNGAAATGAINDPNAYVNASTKGTYDLRWGTPDPAGPGYSSLFGNGSSNYTFQSTFTIFGNTVAGAAGCFNTPCSTATLGAPHPDVIQAWNAGWTGKGVNILIDDDITNSHSVTTSLIAHRYAWGSTIYGTSFNNYSAVNNWDGTTPNLNSTIKIGVINASFGANLQYLTQKSSGWTSQDFQTAYTGYGSSATVHKDVFNGNKTGSNFGSFNLTDAVITKAAGNDSIDAYNEPLNRYLVEDPTISTRLLIVGALAQDPNGGMPLFAEGYSNTAGASNAIKARFLVALGTTPFQSNWVSWNGVRISGSDNGNYGTSYAAPRVAGYVAIVRQKFPNLTAPNTADIMLATARYDTLGCYTPGNGPTGGCDTSKYGQGEASLSRALAPVGYLR